MSPRSAEADLASRTVVIAGIVMAMVVLLLIVYFAASAFFIIFAALVLAAVFDGAARALAKLGLPRRPALILVFVVTLVFVAAVIGFGGATLAMQAGQLIAAVQEQADSLLAALRQLGLPINVEELDPTELRNLLPESGGGVFSASAALFSIAGGLGNLFIILFLAAFVAWQPGVYRRGLVSLFPRSKRPRIAETTDAGAHSLRMWLLGTSISMATVFVVSWIGLWLIDMPYAFLLALQAGLLAFIPMLGAFVAGIPIILTGLSVGGTTALLGLGVYLLIQGVESNVTTPIAQRWASSLPPALTLGSQLVFGLLFGLPGFILAVPVVAVMTTVIELLYMEDVLGGPAPKEREG